jgi:putative lipase involved disintegration of autophagic bodies
MHTMMWPRATPPVVETLCACLQSAFQLIHRMEWLETLFTVTTPLWNSVIDYIHESVEPRTRSIVLVGHGFGGGLAKIVGALTGYPALSISGPGLFFTRCALWVTWFSLRVCVDTCVRAGPRWGWTWGC